VVTVEVTSDGVAQAAGAHLVGRALPGQRAVLLAVEAGAAFGGAVLAGTFQEAPGRQPDFQLLAPAALRGRDVLLVDTGNRRIQEQVGGKGLTRGARGRGIQVDGAYEVGDFITLRPGRAEIGRASCRELV